MTEPLFHIVAEPVWLAAVEQGSYAPASLPEQGFVHFSYRDQVAGTANLLYHQQQDLVVVEFDPARLGAPVVVEDLYDAGQEFPHVYAAIPIEAAVAVHPLQRDGQGNFRF
ncbi:MAG TPA: DUF952 domain-containing protein [Jatrophihabitans sp.]|nr:DUF952 domain-containing protein [Jatrophihabitans sp.]